MSHARVAWLLPLLVALALPAPVAAHDGRPHSNAAAGAADLSLEITVDSEAAIAETVTVPVGARVELVIHGAGEGDLHLHGYDIAVMAGADGPAVLVFEAATAGRYPVAMHFEDPLLGSRDKAVLYVEVRAP